MLSFHTKNKTESTHAQRVTVGNSRTANKYIISVDRQQFWVTHVIPIHSTDFFYIFLTPPPPTPYNVNFENFSPTLKKVGQEGGSSNYQDILSCVNVGGC